VLVRAPTGSGKSLLARAIAGCARTAGEADPEAVIDAYYTTPQVSQPTTSPRSRCSTT